MPSVCPSPVFQSYLFIQLAAVPFIRTFSAVMSVPFSSVYCSMLLRVDRFESNIYNMLVAHMVRAGHQQTQVRLQLSFEVGVCMTCRCAVQAVQILDPQYEIIDGDILATGSLPSSGGALALHTRLLEQREPAEDLISLPRLYSSSTAAREVAGSHNDAIANGATVAGAASLGVMGSGQTEQSSHRSGLLEESAMAESAAEARQRRGAEGVVEFYKAWDRWGALSNFSPHTIDMPRGQGGLEGGSSAIPEENFACRWASVEHYYQAQKFSHASGDKSAEEAAKAEGVIDDILGAPSPEEAARIGRFNERMHPELVRSDWADAKIRVMRDALQQKFAQHAGPRTLLLSTAEGSSGCAGVDGGLQLVENSPHDVFWGCGNDGNGRNMLGKLLQETRTTLLAETSPSAATHASEAPLKQLV